MAHRLLAGHPDAVALEAPLKKKSNAQEGRIAFIRLTKNEKIVSIGWLLDYNLVLKEKTIVITA